MAIIQSIPLSGSGGSSSTYTNMTTDEAIAGTNTEERVISAKVLNDAIDNKIPTIPTVNNAKLTIQKNGTTVKTFTANASANVTCNIEVPTKVSDLDNDSGFLTEHQDISGLETKANAITGLSVNGKVITYTKGDGSTGTITTQDTNTWTAFKGATSSANGTAGYVPAPTKGNQDKFFKADGTWATPTDTTYSVATQSTDGLMSSVDKTKLDGLSNYELPTASSTLGGVKTTSTVTSTNGLSACPIIDGVPYFKDTNTTYNVATASGHGLMSKEDKTKLDGLSNYTLPTASSTLGGVKTTSTVTSTTGLTACPIVDGVPYYKDTNTTYTAMSASEATTGTSTTARSISAKVLNDKIDEKVSALVNSAPETLDTLNELASALGNDPNFATTVSNQIGNKADDDKVVHTSGDETIAGAKTFTNASLNQTASKPYFNIKSTSADLDTDPSSSIIYGLRYYDKNNQLMSYMAQDQVNNGNNALIFQVYNKPLASESNPTPTSSSKRIGYYIGRDFNAYFAPSVSKASDLGTAQYLWGNVYSENYYGTNLGSSNNGFASSYVTTYYGTNVGTASVPFDKMYSSKIGSSATPVVNLYATTIGAASSPVTDLYVTNFHGSIDSATKASQNASGKELSNTIIKGLSISGTTITYTNLDGTTGTLTTQDTNTTYSVATTSKNGLMSSTDKTKLDGLSNYTLPTAGSTLGGVKTTSTVTSTSGLTACPIISGVPYYKDTNTTYNVATTSANGLMSSTDKAKLDGLSNYTLPTASSALGGVKTTSTVTDVSSYTACPIDANGVPYYKDTNTTYSSMSASEATTGTATTARSISAKVLHDKISAMLSSVDFDITEAQIAAIVV